MRTTTFIICLSIFLFVLSDGWGQEKKEKKRAEGARSSSEKTDELLKEADGLKKKSPGEALNKVEKALGISVKQEDDFNEGKGYLVLGEINEGIQEWRLALENYTYAYQKLKTDHKSSIEYQKALRGLGNMNLKLGSYADALTYLKEALTLTQSPTDKLERQLDISEVHYQTGNYEEALKILQETSITKVAEESYSTRIQNQKAKIYAQLNELDKTKDLYQSSISALRSTKSVAPEAQQSLQQAKEEIVDVYRSQKRYDDEIALRNQAIEYNIESNNFAEVAKDKVEISRTLEAKGETSAALRELEEAAKIADTLNNPKEQAHAFLALADLYERSGRSQQAISAYKKYSKAVGKIEKLSETQLIEKSSLIKKQKDIEESTKTISLEQREKTIERATVFRQQLIIYGLLLIIIIIGVTSYFIYKNASASKVANQLLALKSLRSQMNPHFIFNALNSVNHFIGQQDERTANKFLSEFSQLMRLVLENSQEDFIPLQKEQEILSLYIKLEHYRFRDKFNYEIQIDENVNTEAIEVPPMLVQPYIENAIWHGLRYKEIKGRLSLQYRKEAEDLVIEIIDDGIGRKRSAELKTANQKKHNSTGLKNIRERLGIINTVYKMNYRITVEDLEGECGTKVRIYLPINNQSLNA